MNSTAINIIVSIVVSLVGTFLIFTFLKKDKSSNGSNVKKVEPSVKPKVYEYRGKLSREEIAKHNKIGDAWLLIEGRVFDITDYIDIHPGGEAIMNNVGQDSTDGFNGPQHPPSARDVLETYFIGEVEN